MTPESRTAVHAARDAKRAVFKASEQLRKANARLRKAGEDPDDDPGETPPRADVARTAAAVRYGPLEPCGAPDCPDPFGGAPTYGGTRPSRVSLAAYGWDLVACSACRHRLKRQANAERRAACRRVWNDVESWRYAVRLDVIHRPGCPARFWARDLTAAALARLAVREYDRASRKGGA